MNMKRIYYMAAFAAALFSSLPMQAQDDNANQQNRRRTPVASRGERAAKEDEGKGLPELTVRAQDFNERMTQHVGNARWMRVIYRQIDLTKEKNAPLYYPTQPMNGQMNLFSTIFQLICDGKLTVYEYLDGYEDFSEAHQVALKDMLDRFHIFYEEIPGKGGEDPSFVVNESDIPSADVKSYYVKEAWYFDQQNSVFDVKPLAICPILTDNGDIGETTMGMFWVPYESLRPYVSNTYIMTSNTNNVMTYTYDDYFRRRMFEGDIIKTQNLLNQPLQAYCPTPDSLKKEQQRIETQLLSFEKGLWMQPDTTQALADTKEAKKEAKARAKAEKAAKAEKPAKEKTVKTKAPKAAKTTPVRSVRRVRR